MSVDYRLIRSQRRSLEMRVNEEGQVVVRAPRRLARHHVDRFVLERRDWIERQRQRIAALPCPRWRDGDPCRDLGDTLTLDVAAAGRVRVCREGRWLSVAVADPDDEAAVREAVRAWWRRRARTLFQDSIERQFPWFAGRGHALPTLRLKWMRTRWGSLSARGYINLNLALMQYPMEVIDYVVMHELCHLEFMHHGPEFHALMDRRMPDWRARKRLLEGPTD